MADKNNLKVLFVCLGNIFRDYTSIYSSNDDIVQSEYNMIIGNSCRSPMAESILKDMIKSHKHLVWEIDSAALRSWNVGCPIEDRCIGVLQENNISSDHKGRMICKEDFYSFDYIFGMDDYNVEELLNAAPADCRAKIELFGIYAENKNDKIILDPYFETGVHGFQRCFTQITLMCKNFIEIQLNNKS